MYKINFTINYYYCYKQKLFHIEISEKINKITFINFVKISSCFHVSQL